MTHAGTRCGVCDEQHTLLALFGEEGDLASIAAIEGWHTSQHTGSGPFTPADPGEGWAGRTAQAEGGLVLATLTVADDEVLCTECWLAHRPGTCDR